MLPRMDCAVNWVYKVYVCLNLHKCVLENTSHMQTNVFPPGTFQWTTMICQVSLPSTLMACPHWCKCTSNFADAWCIIRGHCLFVFLVRRCVQPIYTGTSIIHHYAGYHQTAWILGFWSKIYECFLWIMMDVLEQMCLIKVIFGGIISLCVLWGTLKFVHMIEIGLDDFSLLRVPPLLHDHIDVHQWIPRKFQQLTVHWRVHRTLKLRGNPWTCYTPGSLDVFDGRVDPSLTEFSVIKSCGVPGGYKGRRSLVKKLHPIIRTCDETSPELATKCVFSITDLTYVPPYSSSAELLWQTYGLGVFLAVNVSMSAKSNVVQNIGIRSKCANLHFECSCETDGSFRKVSSGI